MTLVVLVTLFEHYFSYQNGKYDNKTTIGPVNTDSQSVDHVLDSRLYVVGQVYCLAQSPSCGSRVFFVSTCCVVFAKYVAVRIENALRSHFRCPVTTSLSFQRFASETLALISCDRFLLPALSKSPLFSSHDFQINIRLDNRSSAIPWSWLSSESAYY